MAASTGQGIYYFLGNIPSHILHALPLHKELGGTFVVLSQKAKAEVERYNVPVVALDDKPHEWQRFGWRVKPVSAYLDIGPELKKTVDYLNAHARVVLFYELYDFDASLNFTKPTKIFLTHGAMLKGYFTMRPQRLTILRQYNYMVAMGPVIKERLVREGVSPDMLVDLGIARTDEIVAHRGKVVVPETLASTLGLDPAKPIVSYLPTFWGPSSIYTVGKEIVRNVPDHYTLIFRPHPQTPAKLIKDCLDIMEHKPNVVYAPEGRYEGLGLLDIYAASSAIIGDVSSVMLEAVLTEKPLLFAYDSGEHRQNETDYAAIREVVDFSQKITPDNVALLPRLLAAALSKGIDKNMWQQTANNILFHADGTSVKALAAFVNEQL